MKYLTCGAVFSHDARHRYVLERVLSEGPRAVLFVGLNPSTADEEHDDPTIRRCVGFARDWGFNKLYMGNLHAFRSTDPRGLMTAGDPVGPLNAQYLGRMTAEAELVVAAWGSNPLAPDAYELGRWILMLPHTRCLGKNKDGAPKHPLYLPKTAALVQP